VRGRLAWVEDGITWMYAGGRGGGKTAIPRYFDIEVRGAEISKEAADFVRRNAGLIEQ
jgi:hypothetical protein